MNSIVIYWKNGNVSIESRKILSNKYLVNQMIKWEELVE